MSVSIAHKAQKSLHPQAMSFPAALDTGFNGGFLLGEDLLENWAGLRREHLMQVDEATVYGNKCPVLIANLWLLPNIAGKRESAAVNPYCVHLDPGVTVCPRGFKQPRLPLVGMRALQMGDLQMTFNWRKLQISLRTTPWWRAFT